MGVAFGQCPGQIMSVEAGCKGLGKKQVDGAAMALEKFYGFRRIPGFDYAVSALGQHESRKGPRRGVRFYQEDGSGPGGR